MKIDAKLLDMHYDFALKGTTVTFLSYGNITSNLEEFNGLELNLEIKKR